MQCFPSNSEPDVTASAMLFTMAQNFV